MKYQKYKKSNETANLYFEIGTNLFLKNKINHEGIYSVSKYFKVSVMMIYDQVKKNKISLNMYRKIKNDENLQDFEITQEFFKKNIG